MKQSTKRIVFDKVVDLTVVIVGILLAVSINSLIEDRADKRDWEEHRSVFILSVEETKESYQKDYDRLSEQVELAGSLFKKLQAKEEVEPKLFDEFLVILSSISLSSAVNEAVFDSFAKSNNPYYKSNFKRMIYVEKFLIFKETTKVYFDMYINIILPELFTFRKNSFDEEYLKTKEGKIDRIFLVRLGKGFLDGLKAQYQQQVEAADKLLLELRK